jgi:hypothetical protein
MIVDGYIQTLRVCRVDVDAQLAAAVPTLLDEVERLRNCAECLEIARADVAGQLDEMTDARDEACGELEDTGGEFAIARAAELRKVGPKPGATHHELIAPAVVSDDDLEKIRATADDATRTTVLKLLDEIGRLRGIVAYIPSMLAVTRQLIKAVNDAPEFLEGVRIATSTESAQLRSALAEIIDLIDDVDIVRRTDAEERAVRERVDELRKLVQR